MADVRATAGVPTVSAFGGVSTTSPSTPFVIDSTTGDVYALLPGNIVTKIGAVVGSVDYTIAEQVFGKHTQQSLPASLEDSSRHFADRVFDRQVQPTQPNQAEANTQLTMRAFSRTQAQPAATLGSSSDYIAAQVFGRKLMPAMWS